VRPGLELSLGPGRVCRRAEVSRHTWYRYWAADEAGFLDELLAAALDAAPGSLADGLAPEPTGPPTAGADAETAWALAAETVVRAHFAAVTARPTVMAHLVAAALSWEDRFSEREAGIRPSSVPEVLRRFHERLHLALRAAYADLLRRSARRPAPDSGLVGLVEGVAALADGFALRAGAADAPATADQFARTAVGLVDALTVAEPGAGLGRG
jgi:hypothetical protein